MDSFSLEEDGLPIHSPEVGDRVTAVTPTRQQLQRGITARTQLLLLFLSCLVTYGGTELHSGAVRQRAASRTDHHA